MAKFSVIVVAAGKGERFGGKENKTFAKVDGQPLFLRALQLFVNREDVCQTILVVSPADMPQMKSKFGPNLGFMAVTLVEGGDERFDSVARGLAEVSDEAEFVVVHDACRVCVAVPWIDDYFAAAAEAGAVVPVCPVTATLKRVGDDKLIGETVSREGLCMAQTPQIFRKGMLVEAYASLEEAVAASGPAVTDDAQLVGAAGYAVKAVDGDPRNIKITSKGDLSLASAILKTLPQKKTERMGAFDEASW